MFAKLQTLKTKQCRAFCTVIHDITNYVHTFMHDLLLVCSLPLHVLEVHVVASSVSPASMLAGLYTASSFTLQIVNGSNLDKIKKVDEGGMFATSSDK